MDSPEINTCKEPRIYNEGQRSQEYTMEKG